jgi:DNA-directed RNA polymerase II subunit RPB3
MNPSVSNLGETSTGNLNFTLVSVDVSIANALRRIILSEVPTIVFRTSPYDKSKANIEVNTSRLNNEILKQRLSCIPIHLGTEDEPIEDYIMKLDVTNDGDSVIYVTTEDFTVESISTGKPLSKDAIRRIFPPNSMTGTFIDFARLRPKVTKDGSGESLKMSCTFDVGTAKQDGAFNVVSTCSYAFTHDPVAAASAWSEVAKKLTSEGLSKEEIAASKANWNHLEAKRHFIRNSYDFVVKSVGVYENQQIVRMGCQIMAKKLATLQEQASNEGLTIERGDSTMANCFDITLVGEDYTIGKVIEYMLYRNYFEGVKTLTYCGFRKSHPHIDACLVRVAFKDDEATSATAHGYIEASCKEAIEIFNAIGNYFK